MTMWWGAARSALLLAALLPAACMKTVYLDHPDNSAGGVSGTSDAGPVGGGNGLPDGGGNSDASHLHCSGSATPMQINVAQEKPAFTFALDRSHSMLMQLGMTPGSSRFSVTRDAIYGAVSTSLYSTLVPFGYYEFPTGDPTCSNACCTAGFPAGFNQVNNFNSSLFQCMSSQSLTCNNSDSAPTGQALQKIASAWRNNTTNQPLYTLLLTDGKPSDDCALDSSSSALNACEQTVNFLADMLSGSVFRTPAPPITTIVLAIGAVELDAPPSPSQPTYNSCLNKMAFAGGHPAQTPNPQAAAYTLLSTDASVRPQIDTLVTNAICTFDIDSSFDPLGKYEVDYNSGSSNGSTIPSDPTNGFTLLDKTRLMLTGSWCNTLMMAMKNSTHHSVTIRECVDPTHSFQQPPNP